MKMPFQPVKTVDNYCKFPFVEIEFIEILISYVRKFRISTYYNLYTNTHYVLMFYVILKHIRYNKIYI